MSENNKRKVIRVTLLGNYQVGKTSLRNRFLGIDYEENTLSTVGINKSETMMILENGNEIKLIIWDTAGQERFHSISISSIQNSQGIILVFDVTNRKSFNDLNIWLGDIKNVKKDISIILFGNKCDLSKREVTKEEAEDFANENKFVYFETSSKLNLNIKEGFTFLANDAYKKFGSSSGMKLKKKKKIEKKKKFC